MFNIIQRQEEELAHFLDRNQFSTPHNNNNENNNCHIIDKLLCASHSVRCFALIHLIMLTAVLGKNHYYHCLTAEEAEAQKS